MYNYNYKLDEEVVVISQPENLVTPDIVKKTGLIQRVYDGHLSKNSNMDWFCDLKIGINTFTWISLSCIRPKAIEIVSSPRPEDDKSRYPTYHEMLDHLCRELGVPGSPNFNEAIQWVKKDLEQLQAIKNVIARKK